MVRPEGFEPPTLWFVAKCSIQLSYGRTLRGLQPFKDIGFRSLRQAANDSRCIHSEETNPANQGVRTSNNFSLNRIDLEIRSAMAARSNSCVWCEAKAIENWPK